MPDHYHIPMEDLMAIEVHTSNRQALEELAKTFAYEESKSFSLNLQELAQGTAAFLSLGGQTRRCLLEYLVEKNVPIEVTLRPLKGEQLLNMVEEWVSLHSESSTIMEKLYSNNHRNLLFKRVLFEERANIDDYFRTLSDKLMLRGVDLYQLLVDILSPYHLYEFDLDAETFFEKVNSLNSFLAVVARFVHSEKRIAVGINSSDCEYVRRFEFDRLIEFWEQENTELILLPEKRKNHLDKATQTLGGNGVDRAVQAESRVFSLGEIINEALSCLNKLTPLSNDLQELEAIERMCSMLRKEKIALLHSMEDKEEMDKSQVTEKIPSRAPDISLINLASKPIISLIDSLNHNETIIDQLRDTSKSSPKFKPVTNPPANNRAKAETLSSIYNIYFGVHAGLSELILCLDDIGVDKKDYQKAV